MSRDSVVSCNANDSVKSSRVFGFVHFWRTIAAYEKKLWHTGIEHMYQGFYRKTFSFCYFSKKKKDSANTLPGAISPAAHPSDLNVPEIDFHHA